MVDPSSYLEREELIRRAEKAEAEVRRLRDLINRDRTGLAHALGIVLGIVHGYFWIPLGEWGSYEYSERSEEALRAEIGRCFEEVEETARTALRQSGTRANEAFHGPRKEKAP